MSGSPLFSFAFDRAAARTQFLQVSARDVVLAVLARVPPAPGWEGCLVYEGPSPGEPPGAVCVGILGPSADVVQEVLVTSFEGLGIPVPAIWEGGPAPRDRIAVVRNGVWSTPD